MIAFGKLSGKYKFRLFQGAPVVFAGQHMLNLALALLMLAAGVVHADAAMDAVHHHDADRLRAGRAHHHPDRGADMPVVVSMLNSYSGWAAAGIGFR